MSSLAWCLPDPSVSEEACEEMADFNDAVAETAITAEAVQRLRGLAEACSVAARPDWDGYGANPVSPGSILFAERLLRCLPEGWPSPDIGVDPDGEISFEWAEGSRHVLSVSIGATGLLSYAALFGDSKSHGEEALVGQLPQAIADNLARLVSPWQQQASERTRAE